MFQKYQNEIAPIFYYGISTKTNEKDLKIPNLQPPDWKNPYWMSLYISSLADPQNIGHTNWKDYVVFPISFYQTQYSDKAFSLFVFQPFSEYSDPDPHQIKSVGNIKF